MKKKITLQGILIIVAAALLGITGTTVGVMALMSPSSAVAVEGKRCSSQAESEGRYIFYI